MAQTKRVMGEQEKAFKKVAASLRKSGVAFRMNVMTCCRGCVTHENLGAEDNEQPYGFTYGGQGHKVVWNDKDEAIYASSRKKSQWNYRRPVEQAAEYVMINHGNGSARDIVNAFRSANFDVEWNGSDYECVKVYL